MGPLRRREALDDHEGFCLKDAWLKTGGVWHAAPKESPHTDTHVTTLCGEQVPYDAIDAALRGGPPTEGEAILCERCTVLAPVLKS